MARTTNTVPYTNARRAGRTQPGLIEFRDLEQVPSRGPWAGVLGALMNRAARRRMGERMPIGQLPSRRNPIPRSVRRADARRGLQ